jgi:hypothetical protein
MSIPSNRFQLSPHPAGCRSVLSVLLTHAVMLMPAIASCATAIAVMSMAFVTLQVTSTSLILLSHISSNVVLTFPMEKSCYSD